MPVFETTLFVGRIDLEEIRLAVLADPDPLAAGCGGARRGGRADADLGDDVRSGGGRDRGREQGDECAGHGPNIVRDRRVATNPD